MRAATSSAVAAVALALATGCPGPSGTPASKPATPVAADEPTVQKFEAELVHTLVGGGGSTHSNTRTVDGKSSVVVGNITNKVSLGKTTLTTKIEVVGHRAGKDVYKLTYTVAKPEGSQTKSTEVSYEGQRKVLVEDEYGTLVIRPPAKE
jgi:hypothetical protein